MDARRINWFGLLSYCSLAAGMLTVAVLFRMPYGYYQLMRFVVCGVAGFCAFKAYEGRKQAWLLIAGFITLLFNPFVPIGFDRDTWRVLDLIAAILITTMGFKLGASVSSEKCPGKRTPYDADDFARAISRAKICPGAQVTARVKYGNLVRGVVIKTIAKGTKGKVLSIGQTTQTLLVQFEGDTVPRAIRAENLVETFFL